MSRSMILPALALVFMAGPALAAKIEMLPPVEYPHAGIVLAVPKDFQLQQPSEQVDILRAVAMAKGEPIQSVHLSAFAVDREITAEQFVAARAEQFKSNLAIRGLKVVKETPMPVAGIVGTAQRLRYSYRGRATEAAAVVFIRQMASGDVRICYLLSVECASSHAEMLLPVLGEVVKSISLTAVRCPVDLPPGPLGPAISDPKLGYRFAPPIRWYASKLPDGLILGQMDFLRASGRRGGMSVLKMRMVVGDAPAGADSEAHARELYESGLSRMKQKGVQSLPKLTSKGPVRLSGRQAYQYVLTQMSAPASRPAGGSATSVPASPDDNAVVIVQRTLCAAVGGENRSYSLILLCPYGSQGVKGAEALMEKLAEGFSLLGPAGNATTQPDSAPAEKE